jgi:hypothetical protein
MRFHAPIMMSAVVFGNVAHSQEGTVFRHFEHDSLGAEPTSHRKVRVVPDNVQICTIFLQKQLVLPEHANSICHVGSETTIPGAYSLVREVRKSVTSYADNPLSNAKFTEANAALRNLTKEHPEILCSRGSENPCEFSRETNPAYDEFARQIYSSR